MKIYKTLPDGIQIVEYEDSLAPAVAEMWNKSGEGWGGSFINGVYTAERVIQKNANGGFFNVYIAMKDGEALGYCSLDRFFKDADTAYVCLLNVRPDYHGKKIGKELVLMCVNETIALGMPRLDIHTWPGNTKSVPLYKKCGFFWEDRTDTTHLSNYIPSVLSTDLLKGFFEQVDWYYDSTRKIELKPDGKNVDKFELYEYQWEKGGLFLRVGIEKTGRRINLVETGDYLIELTAMNHELAYGLAYPCRFRVVNKTGGQLEVAITGKSDGVIDFEGNWSGFVADEACFDGVFSVKATSGAQDPERIHPCVLADVVVNGKHAEFGLGIEPKVPVSAIPERTRQVAVPGTTEQIYFNVKNSLSNDATVSFTLPENPLMQFEQSQFELRLQGGKDAMLTTRAQIKGCGYASLPVAYEIKPDDGEVINMTHPLHLVCQGLSGAFQFETEDHYGAANGLWRLQLDKRSNEVKFDRLSPSGLAEFDVAQLGKPYDEEFNLMTPADVRVTQNGVFTVFEADFRSAKFAGALLTEIYELDGAGTLKKRHRVTNEGQSALDLFIKSVSYTNIGRRPVFHYDGGFHEVADKMNYGFDSLAVEKIDENWIFDDCDGNPSGISWPEQGKLNVKWGDVLEIELHTGDLQPGQAFESEAIIYMCGVFKNFREFRNFVLGIQDDVMYLPRNHLEILANGQNPVFSEGPLPLVVRNNRQNIREGTVTVSSPDGLLTEETQVNPAEELLAENAFSVPVAPVSGGTGSIGGIGGIGGIGLVDFSLRFSGFERAFRRALLITDGTIVETSEREGILSLSNGPLGFMVSPEFSETVFSLTYGSNEWLFSQHPSRDPYSWWNPFVGGLKTNIVPMGSNLVLREKITASFVSETDNLGNVWTGIRADVAVENFDKYKGLRYSNYYLTLPGVPVMCHFMKMENGTGRYLNAEFMSMLFLSGKEGLQDFYAQFTADNNTSYRLHPGNCEQSLYYDRLIRLSREGDNLMPEKLYVYKDSASDRGKSTYEFDMNIAYCEFHMEGKVPDGHSHATKPIFCILTEKELTQESLDDLRRIEF